MSQFLKSIISEEAQNLVVNNRQVVHDLKNKVPYLKELPFVRFYSKNGKKIWLFGNSIDDYKIKIYVINQAEDWKAKLIVNWKKETKNSTADEGKDVEKVFGPLGSLEELIVDLDRKLTNNLLLIPHIYHDDWELNLDKEAVILLKKLQNSGEEISIMKHKHFDDLVKMYNDTKGLSDEELIKYSQKVAPDEGDKQMLILNLQKMDKLSFYKGLKTMFHHIF